MALLGLLYSQPSTIIGAPTLEKKQGFSQIFETAKSNVGSIFSAATLKGIIVDATISEEHNTECDISTNPVDFASDVTDHIYFKPRKLTINGVVSDTPIGLPVIGNVANAIGQLKEFLGKNSRSLDAYNALVDLQIKRKPFTVITGLRRYENMMLTSLSLPRDSSTANAINFTASFEEIFIVKSSTTGVDSNTTEGVKTRASKVKKFGKKVAKQVNGNPFDFVYRAAKKPAEAVGKIFRP